MKTEIISKDEKVNQKDYNGVFEDIKSDYFLKILFNILKKNKSLLIKKYNKKLQQRLNLNISDFKNYSLIEIELKLVDNKYGKFINISDEDKKYYHIYFNNSSEEIKRNYLMKMIKLI